MKEEAFEYDLYIAGSDQIWNPRCIDFDEAYLLSFVKDKSTCISYGPSIAIHDISPYKELFFNTLKDYKSISVREEDGAKLIEELVGRQISKVLDPVFLLSKEEWDEILEEASLKKPYILCYFIGDIPNMRRFAKKMRKELNLDLVVIVMNLRDELYLNKKRYDAGPLDFIALIKNASYVCTNSYHAVLFSIIYNINFWVFINEEADISSNSRIINLGKKLGFMERVLSSKQGLVEFDKKINYETINSNLQSEISCSKEYLDTI